MVGRLVKSSAPSRLLVIGHMCGTESSKLNSTNACALISECQASEEELSYPPTSSVPTSYHFPFSCGVWETSSVPKQAPGSKLFRVPLWRTFVSYSLELYEYTPKLRGRASELQQGRAVRV